MVQGCLLAETECWRLKFRYTRSLGSSTCFATRVSGESRGRVHRGAAGAGAVAAAALRGWALVASALPAGRMGAAWVERALAGLEAGLHSGDVDVRGAAGGAIALLYHAAGLASADMSGASRGC